LNPQQLAEGIALAKRLRYYPDVPDLRIEPCGEGMELRLESKALDQQEEQQGERRRPAPH
jgi:hypothetical protein